MPKPKIYAFLNGGSPGWYTVSAIAEDGTPLASHICSTVFFHHDIGISTESNPTNWKHNYYDEHYPQGWEIEWVERDAIDTHAGLQEAFRLCDELKFETES